MNEIDLIKLLAQSGIAGLALVALGWVVRKVGERMVISIDRIGQKIDEHTKADLAAQMSVREIVAELRTDVALLSSHVHTVIEWNGAERERPPRRTDSVPVVRFDDDTDGVPVIAGYDPRRRR
ncbi:MAG TPA: hypothetical protein VLN57_21235 [Xanthobacteraceae bacterium]|nr:hypothetical protein [Xanthobacteraceae bacterium]